MLESFEDLSRWTADFPVIWATWIIKNSYTSQDEWKKNKEQESDGQGECSI